MLGPRPTRLLLAASLCAATVGLSAAGATASSAANATGAAPFLPPPGKLFAGVAGDPVSSYVAAIGKHPAVYQVFSAWGEDLTGAFQTAADTRTRLMLLISTASGPSEAITPQGIADGGGDQWLIGLGREIFASGRVTYIRLMAEMDNYLNPYSAYSGNGTPRDAAHSNAAFKRAWKRVTLILRGGSLARIDAELARLGMPALRTGHDLPRPHVAMLWVPESAGNPSVTGNQPAAYWPGRRWVDWIGTDFYSKFPNFSGLTSLYNAYPGLPFVFGEYALWGSDDPGWVGGLFAWIATHPRARMLIYNQGVRSDGPFRLSRYPQSARELRRQLSSSRFRPYAPELAP